MELTAEHYRKAKIAYDAYVKQAGGVSLATGAKLPEYDALSQSIKDAWAASAIALSLDGRNVSDWAQYIHNWARRKGWWETERNIPEQLALMHSELSEALEELRDHHAPDEVYLGEGGKPEGFGVELADCVIRIMDTCAAYGINLDQLITQKMAYNETRPYRHGGRAA